MEVKASTRTSRTSETPAERHARAVRAGKARWAKVSPEERSAVCRKGGKSRAKAFTPELLAWVRSHVKPEHRTPEFLSRVGSKGGRVTMARYGFAVLFKHWRAWKQAHPSRHESRVIDLLADLGYYDHEDYERDVPGSDLISLAECAWSVDFWFAGLKRAIEVNGEVHSTPALDPDGKRAQRDVTKIEILRTAGIGVLVLDHHELADAGLTERIRAFLQGA